MTNEKSAKEHAGDAYEARVQKRADQMTTDKSTEDFAKDAHEAALNLGKDIHKLQGALLGLKKALAKHNRTVDRRFVKIEDVVFHR